MKAHLTLMNFPVSDVLPNLLHVGGTDTECTKASCLDLRDAEVELQVSLFELALLVPIAPLDALKV